MTFYWLSCLPYAYWKEVYNKRRKEFVPKGSDFFLLREDPFRKEAKHSFERDLRPFKVYSFLLTNKVRFAYSRRKCIVGKHRSVLATVVFLTLSVGLSCVFSKRKDKRKQSLRKEMTVKGTVSYNTENSTFSAIWTAKTSTSLRIRAVLPVSSLFDYTMFPEQYFLIYITI